MDPSPHPPINRLPTELLSEAFVHCSPHPSHLYRDKLPLDLLRVCRRWREVALGTGLLWTALKFDFSDQNARFPNELPKGLSWWIARSGSLPISITATMRKWTISKARRSEIDLGVVDSVIQTICDASHRWKEVDIQVLSKHSRCIMTAANAAPTYLTRLSVNVLDSPVDDGSVERQVSPLPDILDIRIRNVWSSVNGTLKSVRYANIRPIPDVDQCIRLIALCPHLEKLCLYFTGVKMEYRGGPVVAEKLTSMDFYFDRLPRATAELLQKITSPSLISLCITEMGRDPSVLPIQDLLTRSRCQLQQFHYGAELDGVSLKAAYNLYKGLPSLEVVGLTIPTGSEEFNEFLSDLNDTRYLPLLSRFTFEVIPQCHKTFMMPLRNFAEQRSPINGGRLEKITILVGMDMDKLDRVVDADTQYEIQGMGIQFSFKDNSYWGNMCAWDY